MEGVKGRDDTVGLIKASANIVAMEDGRIVQTAASCCDFIFFPSK